MGGEPLAASPPERRKQHRVTRLARILTGNKMIKSRKSVSTVALTASLLLCGAMSAASLAPDLSKYRNFQLGMNLPAVTKQVGATPAPVKVIQQRPALIQELEWRPQSLGLASKSESVQAVVFSFYNGDLFRIAIEYDRYETEGMTAGDFIEAISATYGIAEKLISPVNAAQVAPEDREEIIARWQDPQYCFDLIRSAYNRGFKLVGVLKSLQAPVQASITEAKRLDDAEAPQRDAARIADQKEAELAKLANARLVNKPKFRP